MSINEITTRFLHTLRHVLPVANKMSCLLDKIGRNPWQITTTKRLNYTQKQNNTNK